MMDMQDPIAMTTQARTKLLFWPRFPLADAEITAALGQIPGVDLVVARSLEALLEALPGAGGIVLPDAPADQARRLREAIEAPGGSVRWMHLTTAGRNGFEAAGLPAGVSVTWAPGALAATVAEHAMALLLALARRVPDMVAQGLQSHWDAANIMPRLRSLEGGTLLVVGLGHIGRELARRARGFGMRIEAVTRSQRAEPLVDALHPLDALHERLSQADAIVLCLALTPETRGLVGAAALACCKPDALLVNVGRGALVDHQALLEAVSCGRVGGAALDVTDPEPLPPGHPLWRCPGVLISPHVAGGSSASRQRIARSAAENAMRLLAGEELLHRLA